MLQQSGNNHAYLFYVNRFLRDESFRYSVSVSDSGFQGYLSSAALDHGRRCLVPVAVDSGVYTLLDTLGPGQARLLEFVDPSSAFQADIRVTSPDVFAIREDSTERTDRFVCTAGETITLGAVFYNMGTIFHRGMCGSRSSMFQTHRHPIPWALMHSGCPGFRAGSALTVHQHRLNGARVQTAPDQTSLR